MDLSSQGDLTNVTLAGNFNKIVLNSNGNLTDATITATVVGADGIAITSNSDLENLTLTGATTDKVVIRGNSDLEVLTVDYTSAKGKATTQEVFRC